MRGKGAPIPRRNATSGVPKPPRDALSYRIGSLFDRRCSAESLDQRNFAEGLVNFCASCTSKHRIPPNCSKMAGLKRKSGGSAVPDVKSKSKKLRVEKSAPMSSHKRDLAVREAKPSKKSKTQEESEPLIESDTSEDDNGFYGFSANEGETMDMDSTDASDADSKKKKRKNVKVEKSDKPERRGKHHKESARYDELKRLEGPPKDSTLGVLNGRSTFCEVHNSHFTD